MPSSFLFLFLSLPSCFVFLPCLPCVFLFLCRGAFFGLLGSDFGSLNQVQVPDLIQGGKIGPRKRKKLWILARGTDPRCLFRFRSEIFWPSGGRFCLLESSPARGLVSLEISLPSVLVLLAFSGSVSSFFALLGVDFGFWNQVRHVDLFLYNRSSPAEMIRAAFSVLVLMFFWASEVRFSFFKSSPAPGLVFEKNSLPSDLIRVAFSGSVTRFFTLLGVDFGFLNQVRHVDLFLYRFPCPRNWFHLPFPYLFRAFLHFWASILASEIKSGTWTCFFTTDPRPRKWSELPFPSSF